MDRESAGICSSGTATSSTVGPTVAEVAEPLEEIPADSRSIAFAGENVKPW
jgi:hypothetical protein